MKESGDQPRRQSLLHWNMETQTKRKPHPTFEILGLLCLIFFMSLLITCGKNNAFTSSQERERAFFKAYAPTAKNVSSWAHLWDGTTWIAAIKESSIQEQNLELTALERFKKTGINHQIENSFKLKLSSSFSDHFASFMNLEEIKDFRQTLFNETSFEFSYFSSDKVTEEKIVTGDERQEWFVIVKLPSRTLSWSKILGLPVVLDYGTPKTLAQLAQAQLEAFDLVDDFAWVEPSLMNETLQSGTPKPEESKQKSGPRPPEWEVDKNGAPIAPEKNRVRQVLTRMNWHLAQDFLQTRQFKKLDIPIAVFDSGIDYEHSELKERMFPNPGEKANGVDDDGNGYIDDIYGFDATLRAGEQDKSYKAPGAADVGGPGAPCPAEVKNSGEENNGTCGHGTHVGGIIAANAGGESTFGVCDACRLYAVRISTKCLYPDTQKKRTCVPPTSSQPEAGKWIANRTIEDTAIVRGLNYLLNFKDPRSGKLYIFIVNMSFGKYFYNRTMASALAKLEANGVLVITAAGNDDTDTPMFPSGYDSTFSVCATSEDSGTTTYGTRGAYAKADFSNFGDWVDICAPGVQIFSTLPGNESGNQNGTSMAAPVVAGAAGYLWSVLAAFGDTNASIRYRLERYSNPSLLYDRGSNPKNKFYGDTIGKENSYQLGWGFIDIEAALRAEVGKAPKSFVKVDNASGFNSQVEAGCIVSSIGTRPFSFARFTTSMPFVIATFSLFLFARRRKNKWQ